MDFLHIPTPARWALQLESHLDKILLDHTHWEKESARMCLNLLLAYCDNEELSKAMSSMINDKLNRFQTNRELLKTLGIKFQRIQPTGYNRRLKELIINKEPQRVVDRLLVTALADARSNERFSVIANSCEDPKVAKYYKSLVDQDRENYVTYIDLASGYIDEGHVFERLDELANYEATLISDDGAKPRFHS
ncbi:MAG: tRNA hydroxylase [Rhodopirellula sp.]|nr:tRNA hydroxylase [Rhodopirellula sp.]|tara:strand:- start:5532 stop:6107 length:576 start_codon:yes stop_codon:yes gene_type:complete